jgi:hypothetical protein
MSSHARLESKLSAVSSQRKAECGRNAKEAQPTLTRLAYHLGNNRISQLTSTGDWVHVL